MVDPLKDVFHLLEAQIGRQFGYFTCKNLSKFRSGHSQAVSLNDFIHNLLILFFCLNFLEHMMKNVGIDISSIFLP